MSEFITVWGICFLVVLAVAAWVLSSDRWNAPRPAKEDKFEPLYRTGVMPYSGVMKDE
jgi:hypothetical protein